MSAITLPTTLAHNKRIQQIHLFDLKCRNWQLCWCKPKFIFKWIFHLMFLNETFACKRLTKRVIEIFFHILFEIYKKSKNTIKLNSMVLKCIYCGIKYYVQYNYVNTFHIKLFDLDILQQFFYFAMYACRIHIKAILARFFFFFLFVY